MKPGFLTRFYDLDRALVSAQHPALSPFWRRTIKRFLSSPARTLVVRAGRRSGKSLTACKLAVAFALLGQWTIPPGELAFVAIVSVSLNEAQGKIRLIRAMLDALGVRVRRETATEIELEGLPIIFRATAASWRSAVGFSAIMVIIDEAARLRDEATGANPCSEILSALRPTMATHSDARLLLVSSPLGHNDYHAEQFERGDSAAQQVAHAPTWVGNPTITEEQTHELEPDRRVWAREYAAEPQAGLLSAFEVDDVARAFTPRGDISQRFRRVCLIDASSGKSDIFAYAIAGWSATSNGAALEFDSVDGFSAREVQALGIDEVVSRIAARARGAAASLVFGDQREGLSLAAAFRHAGLSFRELPWTTASKPRGVARVRRLLLEGRLILPPHAALKRELLNFEEKIDGSGQITFAGHTGDHLSCLITCALADETRQLDGSPMLGGGEFLDPSVFRKAGPNSALANFSNSPPTGPLDNIQMSSDGTLKIGGPSVQRVRRGSSFGSGGF